MDVAKPVWRNIVRRSDRGLSIEGTRITLYAMMDHLKAGWSPEQIRDWYNLSQVQIQDVLDYLNANRDEFEAEYQQRLRNAEIVEEYWRANNRAHLEKVAQLPAPPGRKAAWAKLQERKQRWLSN
jgi:uncharacterized protein (DUF433 family)